jgi:prephenate dehydrogenase
MSSMEIKTVGIIGLGKFGYLMVNYLKEADSNLVIKAASRTKKVDQKLVFELDEVCQCDLVIPAVPVKYFEDCIKDISSKIRRDSVVMDVCSVKVHPKEVMLKNLASSNQIICTHPNFGPESYRMNGKTTKGLNYIIENVRVEDSTWEWFKCLLEKLEFNIIEMSAEEHDQKVGIPHFTSMLMGILLNRLDMNRIEVGAASTQKMFDMAEGVGKDFGILEDMFNYNPYAKKHLQDIQLRLEGIVSEFK